MKKKVLILTEKIDAACQVAEALYHIGFKDGDFKSKWADIKNHINGLKKIFIESNDYIILFTNGHLGYDVKPSILNENYGFKFSFDSNFDYKMPRLLLEMRREIKEEKKKFFSILKKTFENYEFDKIYICTDADGEGERIARDFLFKFLAIDKSKFDIKRMWVTGSFNNPKSIKEQLETALPYDNPKYNNLLHSQMARSTGDFLQGMKPTKLFVDLYNLLLYSGRIKNTIIGFIGDRELEISIFKPKKYYTINSIGKYKLNHFYMKETDDVSTDGKIVTKLERTTHYFNEISLNKVIDDLRGVNLQGVVTRCDKKISSSKKRPLPLSGDDFKSEMAEKYKLSLKDSGDILQYLRDQGFTTYQGTNGRYFSLDDSKIVQSAYNTAISYFKDDSTTSSAKVGGSVFLLLYH